MLVTDVRSMDILIHGPENEAGAAGETKPAQPAKSTIMEDHPMVRRNS